MKKERKNPITPEYVQELEERLAISLSLLDALIEECDEEHVYMDEEDEELIEELFKWGEENLAHMADDDDPEPEKEEVN